MIIFNGWRALLAIPLFIVVSVITLVVTLKFGIAFLVGGLGVAVMGFVVNRTIAGEDPATGAPIHTKTRYGFFFIPLQYCGLLIIAASMFFLFQGL